MSDLEFCKTFENKTCKGSIAFGARVDSRALVAVIFTTPTTRIARGVMLSVQRSAKLSANGGIAWPPRRGALPDGVLQALH